MPDPAANTADAVDARVLLEVLASLREEALSVTSVVGEGSRFTITLPIVARHLQVVG